MYPAYRRLIRKLKRVVAADSEKVGQKYVVYGLVFEQFLNNKFNVVRKYS